MGREENNLGPINEEKADNEWRCEERGNDFQDLPSSKNVRRLKRLDGQCSSQRHDEKDPFTCQPEVWQVKQTSNWGIVGKI